MVTNANDELSDSPRATPSKAMIASALDFKAAWEAAIRCSMKGDRLDARQIVEMQESFLGLIWATGTSNVEEALEVLRGVEPVDQSPVG